MLSGCGAFGGVESAFVERSYETVSDEDSTRALFGALPDGTEVHSFTLVNESGSKAVLIDYGATLTQLHVADNADRTACTCHPNSAASTLLHSK